MRNKLSTYPTSSVFRHRLALARFKTAILSDFRKTPEKTNIFELFRIISISAKINHSRYLISFESIKRKEKEQKAPRRCESRSPLSNIKIDRQHPNTSVPNQSSPQKRPKKRIIIKKMMQSLRPYISGPVPKVIRGFCCIYRKSSKKLNCKIYRFFNFVLA